MNIFRSAIQDADGKSVNVGYLSLFWIMVVVLNVIPFMVGLSIYAVWGTPTVVATTLLALGQGVGLITAAFAAALTALGAFIKLDTKTSPTAPQPAQTSLSPQVDLTIPSGRVASSDWSEPM